MNILKRKIRPLPKLGPPKLDARQRILAQWRGADLSSKEKLRDTPPKSANQVTAKVLTNLNLAQRQTESEILKSWQHLVDPTVTAHAQPAGLRNGTLFVNVDSHVWLDEIVRYRRREILDRLQNSFGPAMIKRISFRVG